MENNEYKVCIKQSMCYYFDDIIKLEDFDLDNISIDKNHMKVFWFMTFHKIILLIQNPYVSDSIK